MVTDITKEINKGITMANESFKKDGIEAFAHNVVGVVISHSALKSDIVAIKCNADDTQWGSDV